MRFSDAEWIVMGALWQRGPSSARAVLEAVGAETGWAYTTVKTVLDRLAAKKAVAARRRGNSRVYTAAVSRETARRSAVRSLVARAFDGAFGSLVSHLIAEERLSPAQRRRLAEKLAELDPPRRSRSR